MKRPKLTKVTEDTKTTDHRDTLTKRQITEKKKKTVMLGKINYN